MLHINSSTVSQRLDLVHEHYHIETVYISLEDIHAREGLISMTCFSIKSQRSNGMKSDSNHLKEIKLTQIILS